jgi:sialic acid synthase SpsE
MKDFKIENTWIGQNYKPFVIAEMSGNHNQSLERTLQIVDAEGGTPLTFEHLV